MSGFGFWSHDIGGFESKASAAVYKRWVAFGLLSSHSRLHGSGTYRVPWLYDEEAVDVLRHFTQLKCRLMPYLMQAAVEAHQCNVPMMRAMILEFPDEPNCRPLDRQYLLGPALLVAPVFHERRSEFYLPEGTWTSLLDGSARQGQRWYFDDLGFLEIPLYIRPNHVVAMSPVVEQVDYDYAKDVRLVFGQLDGITPIECQIYNRVGLALTRFTITQRPSGIEIQNAEGRSDFEVQLPWTKRVTVQSGAKLVESGRLPGDPGGIVLRATSSSVSVTFE
jgi:alpha-D-xyloside xylohydrolase